MRTVIAVALGLVAGIFLAAALAGLTGSPIAGVAGGLLGAAALARWLAARDVLPADEASAPRALKVVSAVAAAVAIVQVGRLAVFMVDPAQAAYSSVPSSAWELRHSCLTAYFVAGEAASQGRDVYDDALYSLPSDPKGLRRGKTMGRFGVDVYEYPPPFLLVPRALRLLTADFFRTRPVWFALNGMFALLAMLLVVRRLGPRTGTRALLLLPLVWAGLPMMSMLQKGNVQLAVVGAAVVAMLLFERRRDAGGGAVLAYAIASKLYPGLLVVYLLVRRQWRALAWTAAFGIVFAAATLAAFGPSPFEGFFGHLPKLLSGEAFPAFRNPRAIAINYSVPGLAFKAGLFGVPGMGFGAAKVLGWAFTLVLLWATVTAARREWTDEEKPLVWLAILVLATLRSPFLPQAYGALPPLWLATLLAARRPNGVAFAVLAWAVFNMFWPSDWPLDVRALALLTAVPQAATLVVAFLALRPAPATQPSPTAPAPAPALA